ncbi:hypothetical protein LguiB_018658 [Lonicera macranthoides]
MSTVLLWDLKLPMIRCEHVSISVALKPNLNTCFRFKSSEKYYTYNLRVCFSFSSSLSLY